MDADVLIEAKGVSKKFCRHLRRALRYGFQEVVDELLLRRRGDVSLRRDEFWAIDQVSFQLREGESLGIMGHNGAGKSTLLKLLIGRLKPTRGQITTRGRIVALTELGLGFDPVLSGRENAYVNAAVLGLPRREAARIMDDIIDFSGLGEFIDAPVQTYSSGMRARLGFSVAAHLEPDILLVDEVLRVGDIVFKHKCVKRIKGYLDDGGSLILVSHDPYLVQSICDRCLVVHRGRLLFDGPAVEGVSFYFELGHGMEHEEAVQRARREMSAQDAPARAATAQERVDAREQEPTAAIEAGTVEPKRAQEAAIVRSETADEASPTHDEAASLGRTTPATGAAATAGRDADAFGRCESFEGAVVVINDVKILPVEGDKLETGKPARVVVRYETVQAIDVAWGFIILTSDLIVTVTTCVRGYEDDSMILAPGRGELVCLIPELLLRPGSYALRCGIVDAVTGSPLAQVGWDEPPRFFAIDPVASRVGNTRLSTGDLVEMKVKWEE